MTNLRLIGVTCTLVAGTTRSSSRTCANSARRRTAVSARAAQAVWSSTGCRQSSAGAARSAARTDAVRGPPARGTASGSQAQPQGHCAARTCPASAGRRSQVLRRVPRVQQLVRHGRAARSRPLTMVAPSLFASCAGTTRPMPRACTKAGWAGCVCRPWRAPRAAEATMSGAPSRVSTRRGGSGRSRARSAAQRDQRASALQAAVRGRAGGARTSTVCTSVMTRSITSSGSRDCRAAWRTARRRRPSSASV